MSDFERVRIRPLAFFRPKCFQIHHWIHPSSVHLAMDHCELGNHRIALFFPSTAKYRASLPAANPCFR